MVWEIYVESNEVQFCSYDYGCGLIDIGRGGPFLYSDRKTELEFNFKNFIFDYEPAAWNNGVSENMRGSFQVIDITSDVLASFTMLQKSMLVITTPFTKIC